MWVPFYVIQETLELKIGFTTLYISIYLNITSLSTHAPSDWDWNCFQIETTRICLCLQHSLAGETKIHEMDLQDHNGSAICWRRSQKQVSCFRNPMGSPGLQKVSIFHSCNLWWISAKSADAKHRLGTFEGTWHQRDTCPILFLSSMVIVCYSLQ